MAFNIMDLFGPGALNRLLQPVQSAPSQGFTPNRLVQPFQASAAGQAGAGAPQMAQGEAGIDPWEGLREADVVRADPIQTASVSQPAQQPQARQPFFNDDRRAALNDFFTGMAMGGTPQESIAYGAKLVSANQGTRKNVNETVKWLQSKGMDEQQAKMLAASPPALNEYLKTMAEGSDPMRALQLQKAQLEVQNLQDPDHGLSADERAYRQDVAEGFKGTRMEWAIKMKEAGRNKIDINTGVKLPSGYEWLDPNDQSKGVKPIAGGPAEQIPGELAARVGMGENFLTKDLPVLRDPANLEAATGPIDRALAWAGYGKPAELQRKFQSGVEVLSRLLSGAGMTQVEIDEKTSRYMPTLADGPESLKTKLNQLEAEIKAAGDAAMRGRGGSITSQPAQGGAVDPLGIRP